MAQLTGSCLCGAIQYTVDADIQELRACHCTSCQKASGGAGTVNAVLPSKALKFTKGTPKKFSGVADSGRTLHRYFCGDCGSQIYSQRETTPDVVAFRIGTLDNPGPMKITAHIWTKSARSWHHMEPGAKQMPGQPDAPAPR